MYCAGYLRCWQFLAFFFWDRDSIKSIKLTSRTIVCLVTITSSSCTKFNDGFSTTELKEWITSTYMLTSSTASLNESSWPSLTIRSKESKVRTLFLLTSQCQGIIFNISCCLFSSSIVIHAKHGPECGRSNAAVVVSVQIKNDFGQTIWPFELGRIIRWSFHRDQHVSYWSVRLFY